MKTHCFIQMLLAFCLFVPSNSFWPKPGICPKVFNTLLPVPSCDYDSECPGDEKCCHFEYESVCAPPITIRPGCPKPGVGRCIYECSTDRDCPYRQKCCFNGCGYVCYGRKVKPGQCGPRWFTPDCCVFCQDDYDCPGYMKCCQTTCGPSCTHSLDTRRTY